MIRSMTAFANGETQTLEWLINCELRSVNHRYCDINLKLPENLRFLEGDIRKRLGNALKRGKIECAINYKTLNQAQDFQINPAAVNALLAATAEIEQAMSHAAPFSALEVLAFPGIQQQNDIDRVQLKNVILALLDDVIQRMIATREQEGRQLGLMIEQRCEKISRRVQQAEKRMPAVLTNLRQKLTERIQEMVQEPDFDRLEQELVMQAQKLDVDEELDRLKTHIDEVLRVLKQNEPIGRRLDFLMQEMNREANTLGSKSADQEMTAIAIELKVLIEQMREQIQNIE